LLHILFVFNYLLFNRGFPAITSLRRYTIKPVTLIAMKPKLLLFSMQNSIRTYHRPVVKRFFLILTLCFALFALRPAAAQIPQGFNYQAIARDASGNPLINTALPVTITIQSDSLGGTIFWEELHSSVTTNSFGLFSLVIGKGARQSSSSVASFSDINWAITPRFIRTQIFYKSELLNMGTSRLWSVPFSMSAGELSGPVDKLEVAGKTDLNDEALFEVKNKDGQIIFAVYNKGVRVFVDEGAKGIKGGFAIGGFGAEKVNSQPLFVVSPDSIRAYIDPNAGKTVKGGFAIGGYASGKEGTGEEYLRVTTDSVKVSKSLLIPRLTTVERDNLPFVPGEALIIFNMTEGCMQIYKNNVWSNIWCFNCAPAFIIQPVDKTICSGENTIFFVSATGTNLNYQWQESRDGGNAWNDLTNGGSSPAYSGVKNYTLSLSNIPVGYHSYKYRCIVAGTCLPNITSNSATMNVGSTPPIITTQPTDKQLSPGCAASFSIVSPGFGVSYIWQQSSDGGTIWNNISNGGTTPVYSGATTAALSLTNVPRTFNNYKYRSIVSNLCGANAISNAVILTIPSSSIVTQPSNQQLTVGCSATFSITTPAGYTVSYQWQVSTNGGVTWNNISNGGTGPVYSGVTLSNLSLSNVPLSCNNYQYRSVITSLCGPNETSNAATLSINILPVITGQPVNSLVYEGENTGFNITITGSGFTYQWQESRNGGSTWSNISNGGSNPAYEGTTTTNLSMSNIPLTFNSYKYRCEVSHYCQPSLASDASTLSISAVVPVTDVDGNIYATVGIGSQLWMSQNLKTTHYRNGDLIGTTVPATLNITSESSPKYQWASNGNESNVAAYGRLYTWYAITDSRNVCPTGWHVPTYADWTTLITFVGGENIGGGNLKETGIAHWNSPNTGATNESGFTALSSGYRDFVGVFYRFGTDFYSWTSTEMTTSSAYYNIIAYNSALIWRPNGNEKLGMAVRCIKDN
jgi:uncharacterized protein (TIGR02145 family)